MYLHWKNSLSVIHNILTPFVNTLTVNDKYYLLNRENLTQETHMQLSPKEKTFLEFLFASWKSILNFKHLAKKDDPRSWRISGNTGSEKYGYINVQRAVCQRSLRQTIRQMGQNTIAIWIETPLQYILITVKIVALENASFSDTQNAKVVC